MELIEASSAKEGATMDYRRFGNAVVIRIDRNEEVMEKLEEVCVKENILLGSISGLGAASYVEMGLYDVEKQAFTGTILEQPLEVTSLIGSVTEMSSCAHRRGRCKRKSVWRASEEMRDRRHCRDFHSYCRRTCGPQSGLVFGNGIELVSF